MADDYYWNEILNMWQEEESWSSATSTSICVSGVGLQTSATYYFSVRSRNNIKLVSNPVNSDGVKIIPKLEFSLDSVSVDLGELDDSNDYTSVAETRIAVSTNAYHGYKINAWSAGPLANADFPTLEIPDFHGTDEFPAEWDGVCADSSDYCGFGYSTDKFDGKFAGWAHKPFGKLVAEHEQRITGLTGEAVDEISTITYKASVDDNTLSGTYKTTIIYVITPNY